MQRAATDERSFSGKFALLAPGKLCPLLQPSRQLACAGGNAGSSSAKCTRFGLTRLFQEPAGLAMAAVLGIFSARQRG